MSFAPDDLSLAICSWLFISGQGEPAAQSSCCGHARVPGSVERCRQALGVRRSCVWISVAQSVPASGSCPGAFLEDQC